MPAGTAAALDTAAAQGLRAAATSGAVVAVRSPQGTWIKAYGVADPTTKAPMTTDVHQRIGSVTKTFTGTLVLQLAQQGKLGLDDPINTYVAGVPNGKDVTLRMLLNMTSGLASYTTDQHFTDQLFADPRKAWTPDQLLAVGLALPPLFAPGEKFNYSNTNTILLGKVIEKVTGQPYADVLRDRILVPLGLTQTSMPAATDTLPAPHASGSTLQGTPDSSTTPVDTTDWNPTWAWTAGQMVSTADDLLVYGRALGTGQGLLDTKAQVERLSSIPGKAGYGLGVGRSVGPAGLDCRSCAPSPYGPRSPVRWTGPCWRSWAAAYCWWAWGRHCCRGAPPGAVSWCCSRSCAWRTSVPGHSRGTGGPVTVSAR